MNEDQADKIITLLEEIRYSLTSIESNTSEISSVESNTSMTAEYLRKIKSNLR